MRARFGKGADKSRLVKAHADKAELELAIRKGDALDKEEVIGNITNGVSKMVKRLQGIPTAVATRIAPPDQVAEVKQILTDIIQEALAELYAEAEKYTDEA